MRNADDEEFEEVIPASEDAGPADAKPSSAVRNDDVDRAVGGALKPSERGLSPLLPDNVLLNHNAASDSGSPIIEIESSKTNDDSPCVIIGNSPVEFSPNPLRVVRFADSPMCLSTLRSKQLGTIVLEAGGEFVTATCATSCRSGYRSPRPCF